MHRPFLPIVLSLLALPGCDGPPDAPGAPDDDDDPEVEPERYDPATHALGDWEYTLELDGDVLGATPTSQAMPGLAVAGPAFDGSYSEARLWFESYPEGLRIRIRAQAWDCFEGYLSTDGNGIVYIASKPAGDGWFKVDEVDVDGELKVQLRTVSGRWLLAGDDGALTFTTDPTLAHAFDLWTAAERCDPAVDAACWSRPAPTLSVDELLALTDEEPTYLSLSVEGAVVDISATPPLWEVSDGVLRDVQIAHAVAVDAGATTFRWGRVDGVLGAITELYSAGRYLSAQGQNHTCRDGCSVSSGGADLFVSGGRLTLEGSGRVRVHSWEDTRTNRFGDEVPLLEPDHCIGVEYLRDVGMSDAWYWETLATRGLRDLDPRPFRAPARLE